MYTCIIHTDFAVSHTCHATRMDHQSSPTVQWLVAYPVQVQFGFHTRNLSGRLDHYIVDIQYDHFKLLKRRLKLDAGSV